MQESSRINGIEFNLIFIRIFYDASLKILNHFMLISHNLHLLRILRYTWKVDLVMIFTCAATYIFHEVFGSPAIQVPPTIATLLGTAIAFFIGFNNNQAYDRWWEARIVWGGLINESRTWARNVLQYTGKGSMDAATLLLIRRKMVNRQIAFIYMLKRNLRKSEDSYFKSFLEEQQLADLGENGHQPNALLSMHASDLQLLSEKGSIDGFRFSQMNQCITAITDHMGRCERIRNTVFPTNYVYFTKLFIWALVVFITLILSDSVGVWSMPLGWTVGFIFHVAHQNGMSLMEPFDDIPYGIPLNQMSRTIEINLLQMLGEKELPPPVQPVNDEYIM